MNEGLSEVEQMTVEIAYATPEEQVLRVLQVPLGATVQQLLQQIAADAPFAQLDLDAHKVGVFGQVCDRQRVLVAGDRLELYRPLLIDAKAARLLRAQQQRQQTD